MVTKKDQIFRTGYVTRYVTYINLRIITFTIVRSFSIEVRHGKTPHNQLLYKENRCQKGVKLNETKE